MQISVPFDETYFLCELKEYPWPLGIGVLATFQESDKYVGAIKFLCASDDAAYETVRATPQAEIFKRLAAGIVDGKCNSAIESMIQWQSDIGKQGFEYVSPISSSLVHAI